ncbi:hypothetical protein TGAM01_v207219 [Trichoderma gamsii]|uniref:Short-chain dehydrogenase n=1 Tax=Trichoderma gamsii TaxID=398673 RepID=A0A2P4ZHX7_9HYPO|nr:hypothetical protein TGAM01_v207219 [Trichoderma gamsii]PON23891.1 hypothetical protein TGAM01_v207219 [Trichoderma gamsii]
MSKGTILVTGANGGLGSAIVQNILSTPDLASNYVGIYAVRKAATATALKGVLRRAPSDHKDETVDVDLGSLASVRKTAADINARVAKGELPRIRALILNAGYSDYTNLVMSEDGFEMTWHINYLSNMLLSLLLLQSMDAQDGRILFVSSWSHDIEDARNDIVIGAYKDTRYPTLFPGAELLAKGQWSRPEDDPGINSGFPSIWGQQAVCCDAVPSRRTQCSTYVPYSEELANRIAKDPKLNNISVVSLSSGTIPTSFGRRAGFLIGIVATRVIMPVLSEISVRFSPNGML